MAMRQRQAGSVTPFPFGIKAALIRGAYRRTALPKYFIGTGIYVFLPRVYGLSWCASSIAKLYITDFRKPGVCRRGRVFVNAWDLFRRRKPYRVGRSRRDTVV